ncbi:MAG: hypothetical protein FJX61_09910 [Alphaproteobacteria bacterium]|nr:hypothetical protein [Alphaproteobacteria bacterium]
MIEPHETATPRPRRRDHATRLHRWGHIVLIATLVVLLGSVALLWGWNTAAVDLFQAPTIKFKHALAFEAALAALVAVPLLVARGLAPTGRRRCRLV